MNECHYVNLYGFEGHQVYWMIGHSIDKNVFLFGYELYDGYQGNIYDGSDENIGHTDISKLSHDRQNDVLRLCMYWTMRNIFYT